MSSEWLSRGGHAALRLALAGGDRRFRYDSHALEAVQRRKLAALLARVSAVDSRVDPHWNWEQFRRQLPVTCWRDWSALIERQRGASARYLIDSPAVRYQPTSGSTSAIKWIPYTQQFLAELDAAVAPWLADLYRRHEGVRRGHHYWSLSWLPTSMRDGTHGELNDDMTLLSTGKRTLVRLTQSVPPDVALAARSEDSLFTTLAYLAADTQLSALSVWSPTFALGLIERLGAWREVLADVLASGRWGGRWGGHAGGVENLPCPRNARAASLLRAWDGSVEASFLSELWPRLSLVSAWDTAAAAPWAARLRALLPQAAFQGKGLWSTEGVVTIPLGEQHVLAYRSHVYEFENLDDGRVLAPWELREGQCVVPLLSTGSGLLRYRMNDIVLVDGFFGRVPALRFLGRDDGVDLVGEKIAATFAQSVLSAFAGREGQVPLTLLALDDAGAGRPGYVMLVEDLRMVVRTVVHTVVDVSALSTKLEAMLAEHFHYRLARGLGQLDAARVVFLPRLREVYEDACRQRGMIEGNIKIEPLRHWRGALPTEIATALQYADSRRVAGVHGREKCAVLSELSLA